MPGAARRTGLGAQCRSYKEQAVGVTTRCGGITIRSAGCARKQLTRVSSHWRPNRVYKTRFRHTSRRSLRRSRAATALYVSETAGHGRPSFWRTAIRLTVWIRPSRCRCMPGRSVIFPPPSALRQALALRRLSDAAKIRIISSTVWLAPAITGDESTVWREEDQRQEPTRPA